MNRENIIPYMSLSSRRAWIEIIKSSDLSLPNLGRSPHGERGLKSGTIAICCVSDEAVALREESVD